MTYTNNIQACCDVRGEHCEQCGRADESNEFNEGYSSCCNELIVSSDCRGFHAEEN